MKGCRRQSGEVEGKEGGRRIMKVRVKVGEVDAKGARDQVGG